MRFVRLPGPKIFLFLAFIEFTTNRAFSQIVTRTVALTGQHAPGTPAGAQFQYFGEPTMNSLGHIAFAASMTPNLGGVTGATQDGLWSDQGTGLTLHVRSGDPAPMGVPNRTFGNFRNTLGFDDALVLNNQGNVSFKHALNHTDDPFATSGDRATVWTIEDGQLHLVFLGNKTKALFSGAGITLNDNDTVLLSASNFSQATSAVYFLKPGEQEVIAQTGMQVPGLSSGVVYANVEWNGRSIAASNSSKSAAYIATFKTGQGGVTSNNDSALMFSTSQGTSAIIREGDQAPGMPSGVLFGSDFKYVGINANSDVTASVKLTGVGINSSNDRSLWVRQFSTGNLSLVAQDGTQAPGTPGGTVFELAEGSNYISSFLNSRGSLAFFSYVDGPGVSKFNDSGIWTNRSGTLELISREGDHAPGTPNDVVFYGHLKNFSSSDDVIAFASIATNASGKIAFRGIAIDANETSYRGLWAEDPSGELKKVALTGELWEVLPGDFRTISDVYFSSSADGSDGSGYSFTDDYTLAFNLHFTDGTQGVFTATLIPEPSTWAMIVSCGLAGCFFAARRKKDEQAVAI